MAETAPTTAANGSNGDDQKDDQNSVISEDSDDAPLSALIVRKPSVEERERGVSLIEERFLADHNNDTPPQQPPHEVTPEDGFAPPLSRAENNTTPPSPGQRFLRPSELFAQDNRAAVRAEHPGDLDRAVRNRLSEMWRSVDDATRKSYVERARKVRERARSESQDDDQPRDPALQKKKKRSPPPKKKKPPRPPQPKPPSAAAGLGPGQPVCCANDPQRRGVVVKQTAGSWLLVRFARGGETKARPSQLRALRSDEALTEKEKEELAKPFDPVARGVLLSSTRRWRRGRAVDAPSTRARRWRGGGASRERRRAITTPHTQVRDVQDAVDADVRVAAADGGFVGNVFIDRDGTERRQFEAYALPGGGVGARCGVCGLDQVLPESAVADGGRGKVVHALKSHCGYYAACSMSASNAHIAALQELVAEPLRRGMPGDAERPQAKPRSGSMKDDDSRPRKRPAAQAATQALTGQGRDRSGSANRCGTCVNCRAKKGRSCLENPDEPETKKKKAVKRSPAQRKKPALQTPFLPAQRGYESDESSTLGWVVDVPAWDADEAARLKEKDAALDEFANDFYQRVYDPSKIAALDVCAEHARPRRADDDACACALNKDADPVKAGGLCKDALDALAKRRNGCNGPGALELRWALGARGALAPKDRERAAALLDDNEGRGLDACPREVAKGLSRPLGDVLAWYYAAREPDDKEGEKDAWLGGRRRQVVDGPQRAHLNLNQLHNVADAKDDIDPLKRRHLDAPTIEEKPLMDEVPSLVEGKARPPPATKFLVGEVDVGQRCWVVGSSAKEVAASRRLDLVQLEHAQGTFVEGTSTSVLLPTLPALPAPSPPSQKAVERRLKCQGGEVLEVGSTTHGCRLWYAPRAFETWRDVAHKLKGLHLASPSFFPTTGTRRDLSAAALAGFGSCAVSAPRCAYREDTRQTDPAAAEELWAAQLAFCAPGEAFASRAFSGDDRIIRSLPEATSNRTRPLILLPLRPGWPRVDTKGRKGVPATRKASSDSEDEPDVDGKRGDASFAARRARVCCIVPPSLAKFRGDLEEEPDEADVLRDGDRLWAKLPRGKGAAPPPRRPRVQSDGEPRTKPVTLDARSVATAAVALGCDPVALERRNRASPGAFSGGQYAHETERSLGHGLLLLGRTGASLQGPCARCRVRGERRGFRCRALRRHDAPECHLPPSGGWKVGSRIRCRWADEEDQRTVTWYYASVTEVVATDGDKATLRVLYDDYAPDDPAGQDLINVPDDDTVTCDPEQPRVKASADDRLRIGKTFVWSRNSPREKREPGRWRITDIFDSLEEGADLSADGVVATYARVERRGDAAADSSDDDARAAPTRAEELHLLVKHARWDDAAPPPPPKPLKRRKEGGEGSPPAKKKKKNSDDGAAAPSDAPGEEAAPAAAAPAPAAEAEAEAEAMPPEPAAVGDAAPRAEPMAIGA